MIEFSRRRVNNTLAEDTEKKKKRVATSKSSLGSSTRLARDSRTKKLVSVSRNTMNQGGFKSVSNFGTGIQDATMNALPHTLDVDPLLDGMDYDLDDRVLFNIYRDMYNHDPIAGSIVDLYSTLPFSEFTLSGADDKFLRPYREVIERLNIRTLFTPATVDYLVTGNFISSMLFNKKESRFEDLMTHRADNMTVRPLPFMSQDPIIELEVPEDVKETLKLESPRIEALRNRLGKEFFDKLLNDRFELDPLSTIYVPRKSFSFGAGTSFFKRILPIFLIEKNLYRGTLVESGKRQRGIMHIQLGDGGEWEPDEADMDAVLELFQNADADPLGAMVATRLGVMVDEVRQPDQFWKITDIWDQTTTFKLRALGIGEAFLSGDATINTMEGSMTVFVESLRHFRDHMTRCVLYNKLFPLVSMLNGLKVSGKGKIVRANGLMDGDIEELLRKQNDGSKLFIPQVHWNKQLKPHGDQQYMEMLRNLNEQGIPVPIRAVAAAGGFNLDTLMAQRSEDLEIQKRMMEYKKETDAIKKMGGGGEEDAGGFGGFASAGQSSTVLGNRTKPIGIMSRDYSQSEELNEITGTTKTGKKKWIYNQRAAGEKLDRMIAKAADNLIANKKTMLTHNSRTPFKAKGGHNSVFDQ